MEYSVSSGAISVESPEQRAREALKKQVDRLAEIKRQQQSLKQEQDELEAGLLMRGLDDLQDTKLKSVSYQGCSGKATITMANKLSLVYPSYLKEIFGTIYGDVVTSTATYKLSKAADRMLSAIWQGEYTEMTVADAVAQLPGIDDKARQVLLKKLRGANYDTDKKNLINIGGYSEEDAGQYAYFVAEAAVWQNFQRLLEANSTANPDGLKRVLQLIDAACVVENTPKVMIELLD